MIKDRRTFIPWILFAVILLIYLCFPTKNLFFDGVAFAQMIEDATGLHPSLVHPNHLIYNVMGYLVYKLLLGFGIQVRALEALQIANNFFGALTAYVLFQTLKSSVRSLYLCSVLTLLFAFSATWWKFSTDADAYIPSVLFLLVSFYLILPPRKPRPLLAAVTYSISMCFHQLAVIAYPALVLGLFQHDYFPTRRQRVLAVLRFSGAAFVITLSAYFLCFYLVTETFNFQRFARWITNYSPDASFSFNAWRNFSYTCQGHVRLFFGGRFNLIKGLVNPLIAALMAIWGTLILIFAFTMVRRSSSGLRLWREQALKLKDDHQLRSLMITCVLWVSLYVTFLFFWLPHHTFYRLFYLPALILLAGLVLSALDEAQQISQRHYRAALFVGIIVLSNFLFLIYPYSHIQKYKPLSLALEMNKAWPPGTVIYYLAENSDNSLFRYCNPATIWRQLDPRRLEQLESDLQNIYSNGQAAWIEASAMDQFSSTPEGAAWLSAHSRAETRRGIADPAYNIKFVQIAPRDWKRSD